MDSSFLKSSILQFKYYKELGEKTIEQIPETQLSFKSNSETNNINIIVKHLSGNMVSRWSDFLNSSSNRKFITYFRQFLIGICNFFRLSIKF